MDDRMVSERILKK